jgi:hypothetical protein
MKNICIFIVILFAGSVQAQISELKLTPNDPQNVVSFGYSVAIDNEILVSGTPEADILGVNSGAAVVFEKVNGNWIEDTLLLASDGTSPARFGWAVDVQDNYIFVGANQDPENGLWAGAVYVFKRDTTSGEWNQELKIMPGDAQPGDLFGSSVSISGDYALIGAKGADNNVGAAYIFRYTGTTWVQDVRLTPVNYIGSDPNFGISVSLDNNYALVGAYNDDSGGNRSGAAFIFHYDGIEWTQQAKILSGDISPGDNFGFSVSLSGEYAIVGAINAFYQTFMSGAAYVFRREDTLWVEETKLVDSSAVTDIAFGYSVAITDDYAVIGVSDDNQNGSNAGAAYIYKRINSNWIKLSKLLASDGQESDRFGWCVDIDDDIISVGAPVQYAGGLYCGAVYLYSDFVSGIIESEESYFIKDFYLSQNFPNPFNPSTNIKWQQPETALVTLKIYDVLGREIITLVNEELNAGKHEVNFNASRFSSGVYFFQLKAGYYIETKKMVLMK